MNSLISILVGLIMLAFRKTFAKKIIEGQKTFPWGMNFGEREIKISEFVIIIVGAGFIIFGVV